LVINGQAKRPNNEKIQAAQAMPVDSPQILGSPCGKDGTYRGIIFVTQVSVSWGEHPSRDSFCHDLGIGRTIHFGAVSGAEVSWEHCEKTHINENTRGATDSAVVRLP